MMKKSSYKNVVIIGSGVAYGLGNIPTQKPFWDNLKDFIAKRPESKIIQD